ncbi:MAG: Ktr system potassium uptake protein D, partial [Saprospiraceae bacterium]|nr:Ktr system potassium uptake protein D [Saprospiraceae bacterium]
SLMAVGLSAFLILIFDPQLDPLQVAFESFSAYGTVGLSLGITAELSAPSKLVLVATMFLGRVGFLTLLSGIARQLAGEHLSNYQYPAEPIFIN